MPRWRLCAAFALLVLAGIPRTAWAHKLNVFAYVEGQTIRGEAYYRGRTPARDAKVVVLDPAGKKLSETRTDEQGNFNVRVRYRCDHRLMIDAGEGHTGEYTLSASELPASLPPWEQPAATAEPRTAATAAPTAAAEVASKSPSAVAPPEEEVRALRVQIVQLRDELAVYRQETQVRDIVGAVGYIVGLGGVAFYFLGVRKKTTGESSSDGTR